MSDDTDTPQPKLPGPTISFPGNVGGALERTDPPAAPVAQSAPVPSHAPAREPLRELPKQRTVPLQVLDDPDPDMPASRSPRFMLVVPGVILLLFAASTDKLVDPLKSESMAMLVGAGAMLGAAACFGALGVWSKSREGKVASAVGVGACVLLYGTAVLKLI